MCKEVIYFCAELMNYWSMTFFGLKLFSKVYGFGIHENKMVENGIYALLCLPISLLGAINRFYALYSNFLTHVIVIYVFGLCTILCREKRRLRVSIIGFLIYGMRLIDLWIVAVMEEMNHVSRHIFIDIVNKGIYRIIFLIFLSMIYYLICNMFYNKKILIHIYENKFYRRILCIYSLIGNFCFSVAYITDNNQVIIQYWIFYMVCAFIMVGTCLFYFIGFKTKERERLLNTRNDLMEENYHRLQRIYETNRTLQHDHKNHLLAISLLIQDDKRSEVLDYIQEYMDLKEKLSVGIQSGNDILDIIINSKIDEAKEKQIYFTYEVDYFDKLHIQDIDLCALMANLLDNAIEACEKAENPWIDLKIKLHNDMLLVWLSNSIDQSMLKKKSFFQSEKENTQLHGWGMKSIENVVRKYGGTKLYEIKNNVIEIWINLPVK